MSLSTLFIFSAIFVFVPAGVLSFVFMHKKYGARKVIVLVLAILFFVLYGMGIVFISSGVSELETASLYLMGFSFPCSLVSFILVVTGPNVQNTKKVKPANSKMNYLDELEKLKNLLDSGAITQEEYDVKKSEILNR